MPQFLNRLIDFGYGMPQPTRRRAVAVQAQREIQVQASGEQAMADRLPQRADPAIFSQVAIAARLVGRRKRATTRRQVLISPNITRHSRHRSLSPAVDVACRQGLERLRPVRSVFPSQGGYR